MKKYDFILIEPLYWNRSHYTFDIENLVKIFMSAGLKVAVVNFLRDDTYHQNKRYDVINIYPEKTFPDRISVYSEKNRPVRFLRKIILDMYRYRFFSDIYNRIKDLSDNIYFGSYTPEAISIFMLPLKNKNIYFWGLRSGYFTQPYYDIKNNIYTVLVNLIIRRGMHRQKNIKFFISNIHIYNEFIKGGIEKDRLILRPERTIKELTNFNFDLLNKDFTLSTIGFIREDKNLKFSIDVLKDLDVRFIIAGSADSEHAKTIDAYLENNTFKNIIRINGFLKEPEYSDLFNDTHFVLIADKPQLSTASNGTILETVLRGRPLIMPNRQPYKYYVEEFGIGLLFEQDNKQSLIKTIEKARKLGTRHFESAIKELQKNYLLNNVVEKVMSQMKQK